MMDGDSMVAPAGATLEEAASAAWSPEDVVAQKDDEIARLQEQVKRVAAEFENFRRRQESEQQRRLDWSRAISFGRSCRFSTTWNGPLRQVVRPEVPSPWSKGSSWSCATRSRFWKVWGSSPSRRLDSLSTRVSTRQ